jgi:O-antigen/teichoic acid export membrane protein
MLKKINFILINIFSSGIEFSRSILFLKYMPDSHLGQILLFQAIVAMLGLTQIGLFNGGLRIFSIDSDNYLYKTVNNNNVSFIVYVISSLIIFALIGHCFFEYDIVISILAILCGGFALLQNWFTNLLIARKKLTAINKYHLISAMVSAALAFSIFQIGIIGALISIASSYIIFVSVFLIEQKEYFPTKWLKMDFNVVKKTLFYGFIPYLSGIAVILNNQIDRFFISKYISLEALGQFYLAIAFITVFNLFPNNLNSLFSPSAINNYACHKLKETIRATKQYFLILLLYSVSAYVCVILFGETVISLVFPDKIEQLKYLFIILPGIVALALSKPFSFILYVALNLKSILWSNIFSLVTYISILISLLLLNQFTLDNIAWGKSVQGFIVFVFLVFSVVFSWKKINQFIYLKK